MNKFFYFISVCIIIAGCDLKSKNENANAKNDSTTGVITAPSTEQNSLSQESTAAPVTVDSTGKLSLYGTWVMHAYNSTIQDRAEYPTGMPYITLDSAEKKISGFAGCNAVKGSFEIAGNQLSFSAFAKSDNKCSVQKAEDAFMSFFSGKRQSFEFISGFLYFRGSEGKNFTFRKLQ
jgi:heat shock protein HslJ